MQITDDIIIRILEGDAEEEEFAAFRLWLGKEENRRHYEELRQVWNVIGGPQLDSSQVVGDWYRFREYMRISRRRRTIRISVSWAAVVLLGILGPFILWQYRQNGILPDQESENICPGHFQALLTVDGKKTYELELEREKSIEVGTSGRALNGKDGLVLDRSGAGCRPVPNRLHTPYGGEYAVTLADGTRVRLNAGTTLTFPASFQDSVRRVGLEGEAFFEVARDTTRPFVVETGDISLQVYGTSFNLNTFSGTEALLVSGKIGIRSQDGPEYVLSPSQLIEFDPSGCLVGIRRVDPAIYLAWKDGYFFFDEEELAEVLADLERWYDVIFSVDPQKIKGMHFTGKVERYGDIRVILNAVSKIVGLDFCISGRKITVLAR